MDTGGFSAQFKRRVVAQIAERGCPVKELSEWLRANRRSLHAWEGKFARPSSEGANL